MKLNSNAKDLTAMMALVGAIVLALNAVIAPESGRDMFPWSLGLLAVAILFWIWIRRDAAAEGSAEAVKAAQDAADEAEALVKRREVRRETEQPAGSEHDDLTKLKGIAAGYQRILNEAGIHSYAALAGASIEDLRAIFREAGRAAPAGLETIPRQADYAAKGDWEGLRAFQDSM
ncbi:MAG: hypothetical protein OXI34_14195 [Chloroflexota bacterium]|nr:hypothetical protein [Chloroflexota bacterium]MDE2947891.1 hypothetical protein [Chloroflexota bacterium]